jgi:hypothetical protein
MSTRDSIIVTLAILVFIDEITEPKAKEILKKLDYGMLWKASYSLEEIVEGLKNSHV